MVSEEEEAERAEREALARALLRGLPPPTPEQHLEMAALVLAAVRGRREAARALRRIAARLERSPRTRGRPRVDDTRAITTIRAVLEAHPSAPRHIVLEEVARLLARDRREQSTEATIRRLRRKLRGQ